MSEHKYQFKLAATFIYDIRDYPNLTHRSITKCSNCGKEMLNAYNDKCPECRGEVLLLRRLTR